MKRMRSTTRRIVLYSHDTMGLGHMRRNLLLAETLAQSSENTSVLMIAGATEAAVFGSRRNIDCVTLPALHKRAAGSYGPRHLDMELAELIALRSNTIRAAVAAFSPDLLIVDNVPRGAEGEMNATLALLRRTTRTRIVLGLRDVLDAPEAVDAEWRRAGNEDAIRRYYDAVWVYGDRAVYDLPREYGFHPDTAAKIRYTGYIDQRSRLTTADEAIERAARALEPFVLCVVGGGQDGATLTHAVAGASLSDGLRRVIVTGPYMDAVDRQKLTARAASDRTLHVFEFLTEPTPLVARAASVVAMGGYNTVCEILSLRKRAVVVPRVTPRSEQLIRIQRLQQLGLVDLLHPDDLQPDTLSQRIAAALSKPVPCPNLDLSGLDRLPAFADELLYGPEPRLMPDTARVTRHVAC